MSRLKANANPTIVKVNSICRGNSIEVAGKKVKDVLPIVEEAPLGCGCGSGGQ